MESGSTDRTPAKLLFAVFAVTVLVAFVYIRLSQRNLAERRIAALGEEPQLVLGKIIELQGPSYMDNPPKLKYSFSFSGSRYAFSHSRKVPCNGELPRDSVIGRSIYVAVDPADPNSNWPLLSSSDYALLGIEPKGGYYFDDVSVCF